MAEGIRISNAEYRSMPNVSSSDLKKILKSPLHYKHYKDNPQETDTPSLLFGRAAHKYVLETYDFYNEFAVCPACDRRTKEGKEIYAKFLAESEGKDVITQEQFEQIDAMRTAMLATPYVSKLIYGEHEMSYFWTDKETGIPLKVRPDSINHKSRVIVDYKTCDDAETSVFVHKSMDKRYGLYYSLQAYMYLQGILANTGKEYSFFFIAQEKKPPYLVNIIKVDEDFYEDGKCLFENALRTYKECTETNNWYGYINNEYGYNSTDYYKTDEDDDIEESEEE